MRFEIFAITDIGKYREHNEDSVLVNGEVIRSGCLHVHAADTVIAAVADGLGGHNAGEVASRIALEHLAKCLGPSSDAEKIQDGIKAAHRKIVEYGEADASAQGLGTTLAGVFISGEAVTTFHVGDSRVYLFQGGFIRQLTRDHSLVETMYALGRITREEMRTHPDKNQVTQVLGGPRPTDIRPETAVVRTKLDDGDVLILCSDGLSDLVDDDRLEEIISRNSSLEGAVRGLCREALDRGGYDNISVIGVRKTTEESESMVNDA